MAAIHLYDYHADSSVPKWDATKKEGLEATRCGYMRKNTTSDISKVTCKICLREMKETK